MKTNVAVACVVGLELVATAYLSLLAFLLSGWMVDDSVAFRMTDADWLVAGCLRFIVGLLAAAAFACVTAFVHRRLGWGAARGVLPRVPLLLAGCIALASGLGATLFVIDRPFM
jgi:hypothetical protein